MFGDVIYYPSRSEQSLVTILIGGVLTMFSWLVIPALFVFGFLIRVLEQSAGGDEEPPAFDEWGDLAVKGVVGIVITVVFYLIPLVAFAGLGGLGALTGSGEGAVAGLGLALVVSFVLFVALTFVYPAALTNYAATGSIGAAFAFGDIKEVVTSGGYLGAWAIGFVLFLSGFILIGFLSLIPLIGTLIGLFVNFYVQVAAYRAFGLAYARATTGGTGPAAGAAPA